MNNNFIQNKVSDISEELIQDVIKIAKGEGHKSHAPLGCSGDTFILYGESRRREISLRLHSGDVKMLITDNAGGFLFYGGYDLSLLPIKFIAKEYRRIIQNVEYLLDNTSTSSSVTEEDKEKMNNSGSIFKHLFGVGF
jgi:hypothetical protein